MRDATIRLQDLDGTWTTLGTDRASGIYAQGLNLTSNDWGPDTATFELHRNPSLSWPDLSAFTPVEIEVGNQLCWSGRVAEAQVQDGSTRQLSVRCEGRQYELDDDQFARTYYTRSIGDWQPITDYVPVGTDWVGHGGTVDVRDGSIWMGWRAGSVMRTGDMLGLVLDLGAKADYGFGRLSAFGEMHMEGFKFPLSTVKGNYGTNGVGYITTAYGNDTNGPAYPSNQNNSTLPVSAWSSGVSYAPGDVVSYNATVMGGYQQVYIKQTGTGSSATTPPNDSNWFQVRNPISVWVEFFPDLGSLYSAAQWTRQDFIDNYESVFGFNKAVATTDAAAAQSCSAMLSTGLAANDGSLVRPSASNQGKNIKQAAFWKTASNSARYCLIAMSTSGYGKVGTIATGAIRDVQPLPNSYGLNLGGLALTSSYTNSQTPNLDPTTNSYADIVGSVASALKASAVVRAAVSRAAQSLTTRQVQDTSLNLQHVKTDGFKTPREVIQDVNSFHGWVSRVDADGDLVFKPQPTAPRFELGSWSGYEFTDQAASSGEDIYSRVIVEGLDPFGQLNQVVRTAAQVATSVRLSTPGASTLTAAQQQSLNVVSVQQSDVAIGTPNGKIPVDTVITATPQMLAQLTPAGTSGATAVAAAAVSVNGVFRAGVTYEFTGSINIDGPSLGDPPQDFLLRFGNDGYAIGTSMVVQTGVTQALTTETYTNVVRLTASNSRANWKAANRFTVYWTPATDQTLSTAFGGMAIAIAGNASQGAYAGVFGINAGQSSIPTTNQLNIAVRSRAVTLAERRGLKRTFMLSVPGSQTNATLTAIADAWLFNHLRAQFRGTMTSTGPTAFRQADTGDPVHPSRLLLEAGEVIRLSDRVDPDTGQLGREARVASVSYDHDAQSVSIELDNRRDNLQTFLNRLAAA